MYEDWVIVGSSIEAWLPEPDVSVLGWAHLARLPPEFGFTIVVWNPAEPDQVREIRWNTEEQRRAHNQAHGTLTIRAATKREKRDGQAQRSA